MGEYAPEVDHGCPTGEIVARLMMARACGCVCEFQHYAVDKYRPAAREVPTAGALPASPRRRRKGDKPRRSRKWGDPSLPVARKLSRRPDGKWAGTLSGEGTGVEAIADWPQGLAGTLARLWVAARTAAPGSKPTK